MYKYVCKTMFLKRYKNLWLHECSKRGKRKYFFIFENARVKLFKYLNKNTMLIHTCVCRGEFKTKENLYYLNI